MEYEFVSVKPTQEELEWYTSGKSGGRDGKGVAVRLNTEEHKLEPDSNFEERVRNYGSREDIYTLREMPDLDLINRFIGHSAIYNSETHRIEPIIKAA